MQNDTQGGQRQPAQDNCGVENRDQSQEQRASEEDEQILAAMVELRHQKKSEEQERSRC